MYLFLTREMDFSPREVVFHLVQFSDEVTGQKWSQWSSCAFVCDMQDSYSESQKQLRNMFILKK